MTKVATILPIPTEGGDISYDAVSDGRKSSGKTAGEALDALTAQLPDEEDSLLIILQKRRPDRFFSAEQQKRLQQLMERWRAARDKGDSLPDEEQSELEQLVEMEVAATRARAAAIIDDLSK